MNAWSTIRVFLAVLLVLFGIGLMFVRTDDARLEAGAVLAAIGVTFLLRLALALRQD